MSVQTGLVTVEEFLKLPQPKEGQHELRHGEVVVVPPPKWGHLNIQRRIQMLLTRLVGDGGIVCTEMGFRPSPEYEVWLADVGLVRGDRAKTIGDDEYVTDAPDLVVEVLSPSNTADEINDRMTVCIENGCHSFWVVDPKRKKVSVTEGDVTKHYGASASISCDLLSGVVQVRDIFQ